MNKDQIIEAIEKMTVLELAELVKALEEKFGVSAAAPVAVAAAGAAPAAAAAEEEQTEFDVILKEDQCYQSSSRNHRPGPERSKSSG